jgi:branched-chain amino acid transport system substrate-binding protein
MTAYDREPYRIGVLLDFGVGSQPFTDMTEAIRLVFELSYERGLVDRVIEIEYREIEGLGFAQWSSIRRLWRELVYDRDCLCVIGPHFSHSVVQLREEVDAACVPMVTMAAAGDAVGDWQFTLPNGTHSDEGVVLADYLHTKGVRSVALLADAGMGDELMTYFRARCARLGITLSRTELTAAPATETEIDTALHRLREADSQALAYMGLGVTNVPLVLNGLARMQWEPLRVASSLFMMSTPGMGWGAGSGPGAFEGWIGIDQVHESNRVLTDWLDAFEARHGRRPRHTFTAIGLDLANTVVEAIAQAPRRDPSGLRIGLERVRRLPAAVGRDGNVISFHPFERRGYKGDYLVLRQVVDGAFVDVT